MYAIVSWALHLQEHSGMGKYHGELCGEIHGRGNTFPHRHLYQETRSGVYFRREEFKIIMIDSCGISPDTCSRKVLLYPGFLSHGFLSLYMGYGGAHSTCSTLWCALYVLPCIGSTEVLTGHVPHFHVRCTFCFLSYVNRHMCLFYMFYVYSQLLKNLFSS